MKNLYHDSPYLTEKETKVLSVFKNSGKNYVQLEDNIFYPRGGGQKGDKGLLIHGKSTVKVVDSVKSPQSDEEVLLITETEAPNEWVGKKIIAKLDEIFRKKQMRLHSMVHLHHFFMEQAIGQKLPYPKTSDILDGFAFNRYESEEITEEIALKAGELLKEAIKKGAPVKTYADDSRKGFRFWECFGWKVPCGGTHIENISEIGDFSLRFSKKKGMPTINLEIK